MTDVAIGSEEHIESGSFRGIEQLAVSQRVPSIRTRFLDGVIRERSCDASCGAERSAGLSPNGRLLYLLLERDGFRCLYALPVDPGNGHPIGEPFLVQHFHDPSRPWGSTGFGSATVTGMFVADLYEITGNVWMTTIK